MPSPRSAYRVQVLVDSHNDLGPRDGRNDLLQAAKERGDIS